MWGFDDVFILFQFPIGCSPLVLQLQPQRLPSSQIPYQMLFQNVEPLAGVYLCHNILAPSRVVFFSPQDHTGSHAIPNYSRFDWVRSVVPVDPGGSWWIMHASCRSYVPAMYPNQPQSYKFLPRFSRFFVTFLEVLKKFDKFSIMLASLTVTTSDHIALKFLFASSFHLLRFVLNAI